MKSILPKKHRGFQYIRSAGSGHEYFHVKNGLRVLLFPKHDIPVVAVMVTYHVGSRNEHVGTTGSTHILEHMMFKGSKNFDPVRNRGIGDVIEATGAMINATTWNDRTNYYEIVEEKYVENALSVEADRMSNILLRKKDLISEMVVVRNEYERGRNDPLRLISADVWSAAFINHPYHFDTIGIKEDIENVTVDELRQFHAEYYCPNNATVTLVGDCDVILGLNMVAKTFGKIPKKPLAKVDIPVEPEQHGERRITLKRAGNVQAVVVGYKIPEGRHKDSAALTILSAHLTEGKGSVLHKALVDSNIATGVNSFVSRFYDPGLFEISVTLGQGILHAQVEEVLSTTIHELVNGVLSDEDVLRAVELSRSKYLGRLASYSDLAHTINESLALGDWTDAESFPNSLKLIKRSDVIEVAKRYLLDDTKTLGILRTL